MRHECNTALITGGCGGIGRTIDGRFLRNARFDDSTTICGAASALAMAWFFSGIRLLLGITLPCIGAITDLKRTTPVR